MNHTSTPPDLSYPGRKAELRALKHVVVQDYFSPDFYATYRSARNYVKTKHEGRIRIAWFWATIKEAREQRGVFAPEPEPPSLPVDPANEVVEL